MARTARSQKLDTRTARAKLPMKKSGYWVSVARGCALGYRKGAKGGTWLAKLVRPDYRRETAIGPADDALDADGIASIDYATAQDRARAWFAEMSRVADGSAPASGPYTVANALADYVAHYAAGHTKGGGKAVKDTETRIAAFILPALGDQLVAKLTAQRLRDWHAALAAEGARLRTKSGTIKRRVRAIAKGDAEAVRRRRATANRTLTVLKAALNHAFREGQVATDEAWRRVLPFREVDTAKVRYLDGDEVRRLVTATDAAFRPMVQAALLSGCRYGELAAFRVGDFDATAATVTVRMSKGGKPRHVMLTDDGVALFQTHAEGKSGDALVFPRPDGEPWGKSHQHRQLRAACKRAKILPAASFHILRHTYASTLARAGVPMQVIAANLGHSDTRMVEKHYAHLAPSHVANVIRAAMPSAGIIETTNGGAVGGGH
ncbi:MAG: site-specific integrase [Rhodospirillales bacterium]|nr:site-specific integrase [Rhodospirillales bacterium]